MATKHLLIAAALVGAVSVLLGAFGAHGLKSVLTEAQLGSWRTAVHYHQLHALLALALCLRLLADPARRLRLAVYSLLAGIALFSGSLYGLALGAPAWFGPVTPIGGLLLMIGWLCVVAYALRLPAPER
ncbi:DUF423 domain-containing protein [Simiduia sp. 21SJ11W-1]|uniref:DUF423 domain-containing protein n=1 Tax=Simiduia sp. 21SJ11W-1 TaxID=2909669 RepID=UPI00209F6C54|nr:DUF423 domain-containing protein [Simiduia sp. 21SJ11W-1]UTA48019.1 DUF423 domain-containing protein [Simiduia sp. 21SJ11W-1]